MRQRLPLISLTILLVGCALEGSAPSQPAPTAATGGMGMGMGRGMGPQSGMMARHSAPIPEEYAGLTNPIAADEASLRRGGELFVAHCATCHGDGGMGDGPAAAGLDPAPVPIARTSQMMGDSYLFYRISEGGAMAPFNSAMPAWKDVVDEDDRWHLINYVRALGSGVVTPVPSTGGAPFESGLQATRQAEMLDTAVSEGILTVEEAALFNEVHTAVETLRGEGMAEMAGAQGDMAAMEARLLAELVAAGTITQAQADAFADIHGRLIDAGLME